MNPDTRKMKVSLDLRLFWAFAIVLPGCLLASILCWRRCEPVLAETHSLLSVRSASFSDGGSIPRQFTCDGGDLSPQLEWQTAPADTKSFALVMNDPDAPVDFTHWLVYNMSPGMHQLDEGASMPKTVRAPFVEGENAFGRLGYGGPCPPPGNPHHYYFKVYALDISLDLPPGATRKQVEAQMSGHILAQGQIVATYKRMYQ